MDIFIGSARESEDAMRWLASCLEEYGHKPISWDDPGLFPPGENTFLRLIDISKSVDAAIFIFSEDDKVWYRGDAAQQPRDNVLIEYGLFSGQLGPKKAIICVDGKPKSASDLLGISYVSISEKRRARARLELSMWANRLTSEPIDLTTLRLMATIRERDTELDETKRRLEFESEKSKELAEVINDHGIINFREYDLTKDGYWKLLYDFRFFWGVSTELTTSFTTPRALRDILINGGSSVIAERISWDTILEDKVRTGFVIRKCLRIFRTECKAEMLRELFLSFDTSTKKTIERLTSDSITVIQSGK
jgi:Predicted nucleotide-binding protein containing TIR-like domain